ncbi:MAG TPA: kelch repeat-containing protein [Anaerolineae bacterium]|nr:kelch repeat-containing protein [Anaerolineae bacterium]
MKLRFILLAVIVALLLAAISLLEVSGQGLAGPPKDEWSAASERVVLDLQPVRAAIRTTHVYTSSTPMAIPDASCPDLISSTLTVPDSFPIAEVKVGLWVEHPWRGDLSFALTAPDGTAIDLLVHPDGSADNLNVILDDSAPGVPDSVDHVAPPPYYPHWWQPSEPLSALLFGDAQGTWTLAVCDDAAGDEGTLRTWALFLGEGISLAPSYQTGADCPGEVVAYDVDLVNATGLEQSFALAHQSLWPSGGVTQTLPIPALTTSTLTIASVVPWFAVGMETDLLTVTATGQGGAQAEARMLTMASLASGYGDLAPLPAGRGTSDHALVYAGGKLFKIGGRNAGVKAWLDVYDIATGTWSAGPDMPGPRTWIDAVAIDGRVYVAGGWSTYAQPTLYIYDPASNSWSTGAPMPEPRFAYAGVALGGRYYVIGGTNGLSYQKTLWAYDPATNSWDTGLPSMAAARRYPLAGAMGGKLYVAGGMSSNITYVNATERYDPATAAWSVAAPLPADGWVRAADAVLADRYLVLAGGASTDVTASASALAYDSVQDLWGWLPKMGHLLYALEGDGDGNRIWLVSGRLYENEAWSYSLYNTESLPCPACIPVLDAAFTWTPTSPLAGSPATFTATAQGSPPIAYAWDWGDGTTGSGNPALHTYAAAGTYTITMTASNCGQQVIQHSVTVVAGNMLHLNANKLIWRPGVVPGTYAVLAALRIHDQNHAVVQGATLSGTWTLPDATTVTQTTVTNPLGLGKFTVVKGLTGTYQFCLTAMSKAGYVYDPDANEAPVCKTIVVGP